MATNVDRPNGFKPVGNLLGGSFTGQVRKYYSDGDNLFLGDIVIKDSGALANPSGDGAYPACARMSNGATDVPLGVVVGWERNPASLENLYHPASATYCVYVNDDPFTIYEAQTDGLNSALTVANVGINADVTIGAGSTTSGASGMEIAVAGEAVTAATPLKLLGVVARPDNDISTAGLSNARWLVMLNMHAHKSDAGTAGI